MFTILLVIHGFLSLCLVGLVLLQQGKGADMGATIGGGGSSSVFGGAGAVDFIAKLTTGLAIAFMCTSILLVRAYTYRAPSALGTKSQDFLKGSLFDESDEMNDVKVSEALKVEEASVQRQAAEGESQQNGSANSGGAVPADSAAGDVGASKPIVNNPGVDTTGAVATAGGGETQEAGSEAAVVPPVSPDVAEKSGVASESTSSGASETAQEVEERVEAPQVPAEGIEPAGKAADRQLDDQATAPAEGLVH